MTLTTSRSRTSVPCTRLMPPLSNTGADCGLRSMPIMPQEPRGMHDSRIPGYSVSIRLTADTSWSSVNASPPPGAVDRSLCTFYTLQDTDSGFQSWSNPPSGHVRSLHRGQLITEGQSLSDDCRVSGARLRSLLIETGSYPARRSAARWAVPDPFRSGYVCLSLVAFILVPSSLAVPNQINASWLTLLYRSWCLTRPYAASAATASGLLQQQQYSLLS